ncbi:MAG: C4-dicarboxylate ABC transporter permease [Spirochaetae bacterium HGW-Spirochaetae-4]|nr:MAG: C4-dicarboxylate ABC transporter permease [Spirochaetae bacterium HGW-Spirochaetae-4]HCG64864.1 C4-dicarboxylate ABC transporter permease [Sphaerochaeta sp.]HCS35486.1 C4-dicarboxylate ABC transporter permease [Sphaerochaeta sp.]
MTNLMTGFALVFQPLTFLLMVFGVGVGVIIGALPGLTASMGIILLLPLVYRLPANVALVMLCGLFCGGMYGGSISAILLKTPGTPSASATLLDGYPLCEQGKAGKALGISTISSFIGGLISTVCLILIAPQLAKVALKFQAADYFSLSIFGLTIMASSSGKKVVKGLIAGCIGLLASCVGIDTIVGVNRLTFNNMYLAGGFTLLPVLIGVFAISEVLSQVQTSKDKSPVSVQAVTNILPTWLDIKAILPSALVGGVLGVFIGIIPGTGGAIACFLAYNIAQKFAKDRHLFGKGALSGVAAPESANNATTGGALIPMLCLGVPGDVVTSVMLGALILIGVRPGPLLFVENVDIVYSIFAGMIIIQFLMLGFGLLSSRYAPLILKVPYTLLMPIIMVLCVVGSFSLNNALYDVTVALGFGVLGFFLKRWGYPGAPLVLGIILGPMAEENLNRALLVSNNSWSVLVQRPISLTFLILATISIGISVYSARKKEA